MRHGLRMAGLLLLLTTAGMGSLSARQTQEGAVMQLDSVRSDRPVLLFFTASWCGPCRMVKGMTFRDPDVAALLQQIDIRMLDIDTPAGKAYQKVYGSGRGGVPELVLLDRTGEKIASLEGYGKDPQRTVEFLERAFGQEDPTHPAPGRDVPAVMEMPVRETAEALETVALPPQTSPEAFLNERPGFMLRLSGSAWTLNFGAGVSFSGIASSPFDGTRTGFYVSATTSLMMARRWEAETGFEFDAVGGKSPFGVLRSYYLTLPAEVQYRVATLLGVRLFLAGGLYGACRVGYAAPDAFAPERWDAGVRGRLIFEAGTFRLSAGYSRGLMHCLSDRGYNQTFRVGLAICLGK